MKKHIVSALSVIGFTGSEKSAWTDVKSWLEANGYADAEFVVDKKKVGIDGLEKAWNAKTVTISVSADAGEEVQVVDGKSEDKPKEEEEEEDDAMKSVASEHSKKLAELEAKHKAEREELEAKAKYRSAQATARSKGFGGMSATPFNHARIAERKAYEKSVREKGFWRADGRDCKAAWDDADTVELFGAWARSVMFPTLAKSEDLELITKANIASSYTLGGSTVPVEFDPGLINLKETYGVARQIVGVTPMASDLKSVPRRTGGMTVYFPGEGQTITESNPTTNDVELKARKMAALGTVSAELINDSAINYGAFVAEEIAYGFALKEDQMIFNGDGTSTYGGVIGFRQALKGLSSTIANISGIVVGAGNAYSELTLANFESVAAILPEAFSINPYWTCSKAFYWNVMHRLAYGVGGVTASEVVNGVVEHKFLGYPVKFVQVMPQVEGNSQVCALFGNYGMAAKMGEVRGSMVIAQSDQRYFEQDKIAIRGTQRIAVTVHDVGNATATAADRAPGPVVGLITAAS